MKVKTSYIVLTKQGLKVLYYTEDGKYFINDSDLGDALVWLPDFVAERLISMFTKVEHYEEAESGNNQGNSKW